MADFPFTQTEFCRTCGNLVSIVQPEFCMATIKGKLPGRLAESVSDALATALASGMEMEDATSVVIGIAADYWRMKYGDDVLDQLATVVTAQRGRPLPPIEPVT